MAQCKATRKDGQPCTAQAAVGRDYCFFHDPAKTQDARAAQAKGGSTKNTLQEVRPWRGLPGDVVALRSPSPADLINLLADTIDEVKTGKIDPKVANATGYLVGVMVKILEYDALEERLATIEEALAQRKTV